MAPTQSAGSNVIGAGLTRSRSGCQARASSVSDCAHPMNPSRSAIHRACSEARASACSACESRSAAACRCDSAAMAASRTRPCSFVMLSNRFVASSIDSRSLPSSIARRSGNLPSSSSRREARCSRMYCSTGRHLACAASRSRASCCLAARSFCSRSASAALIRMSAAATRLALERCNGCHARATCLRATNHNATAPIAVSSTPAPAAAPRPGPRKPATQPPAAAAMPSRIAGTSRMGPRKSPGIFRRRRRCCASAAHATSVA